MTKTFVRIQNEIENREERGAAMAEYGLLLALVALVAIGVLATFGSKISQVFSTSSSTLDTGLNANASTSGN